MDTKEPILHTLHRRIFLIMDGRMAFHSCSRILRRNRRGKKNRKQLGSNLRVGSKILFKNGTRRKTKSNSYRGFGLNFHFFKFLFFAIESKLCKFICIPRYSLHLKSIASSILYFESIIIRKSWAYFIFPFIIFATQYNF